MTCVPVHEVLDDLMVSIPAGENQRCRAVGLGRHQLGHLLFGPVVQKYLEIRRKICITVQQQLGTANY